MAQATLITLYDVNGQPQQVPSYDAEQYKAQGFTDTNPNAPEKVPNTPEEQKAYLLAQGIDPTGLDDTQLGWLTMMGVYQQQQAKNDKNIAPSQLTPDEIKKYTDQATAELGPQFANAQKIDTEQVNQAIGQATGDIKYAENQRLQTMTAEQKQLADQMAEKGLAISGIRKQAEHQLQTQEKGIVRSEASQNAAKLRNLAGTYEKTYGGAALAALKIPAMSYAGVNITPQPLGVSDSNASALAGNATTVQNEAGRLEQQALGSKETARASVKPNQQLTSL